MSNRRKAVNGSPGARPSVALLIAGDVAGETDRVLAVSDASPWRQAIGGQETACYGCYFGPAAQENDPYVEAKSACITSTGGTVFLCEADTELWRQGGGQYTLTRIEPLPV